MVVDSHPTIRNAPYELSMRIKRGTLHGGSTSHSYVQTFVDDELVDTTPKGPPDWNRPVVKKLMTIVPTTTITFVLYSMPLIAIPVPGSKAVAPVFRGKFQTNIGSFLHTLGNGGSDKEFPFSPSKDTLVINIELKETKLFTIISAHPPLLTELAASSAMEVSPYLKKRVCLIDNASNQFLNLILAILLENTALVNEPDMVYLVGDICDMVLMYVSGGKHVEQMDEVQRLPKSKIISNTVRAFTRDRTVGDLASKLSEGVGFDSSSGNFGENLYNFLRDAVTSYDKTTLYPYVSNIYNTFVCPKGLYRQKHDNSSTSHVKALIREQEIIWRNEKSHTLQPCMSSCYNMATERHLLRRLDFRDNSLYDIIIHCSDETSYELRWADYYDYIMALKHISTVKFSLENADAAADQIFTTKCSMAIREDLLFNPSKFNTELPNDQRFQIIFSIQTGSGCFLLEDEDHLFDEDSNEISIPFDGVRIYCVFFAF